MNRLRAFSRHTSDVVSSKRHVRIQDAVGTPARGELRLGQTLLANQVGAADMLQTVYLKILDGKARYDGKASFKTWLFAVIRNTAAEARRQRGRRRLRQQRGSPHQRDEPLPVPLYPVVDQGYSSSLVLLPLLLPASWLAVGSKPETFGQMISSGTVPRASMRRVSLRWSRWRCFS